MFGDIIMYMLCIGELRWITLNISFNSLTQICLSVAPILASWSYSGGRRCTQNLGSWPGVVREHKDRVSRELCFFLSLNGEATKATWESYMDTWQKPQSETRPCGLDYMTWVYCSLNHTCMIMNCIYQKLLANRAHLAAMLCLIYPYQTMSWWIY